MRVLELWRYPIKSVGGERLDTATVTELGIVGDRAWGLVDETSGFVLTGRREPRLLFASCRLVDGGPVAVTDDGRTLVTSADWSGWLDRPVRLEAAGDTGGRGFLKRELAALRAIEHDRVPSVYDWNLEGKHPFIALQYFPAGNLSDARRGTPSLRSRASGNSSLVLAASAMARSSPKACPREMKGGAFSALRRVSASWPRAACDDAP